MSRIKITETDMLNWLIRRSDPIELFGPSGIGPWNTEAEFLELWREAIRYEIKRDGHD